MSSSESSSRRQRPATDVSTSALSADRRSSRTMGCVGFSIVAHAAFLAALAVSQEHVPEMMGHSGVELVSGAASGSEAGSEVSFVETETSLETQTNRTSTPEPTGVLTDATSDIALPDKTVVPEKVAAPKPTVTAVVPKAQPKSEPVPEPESQPSLTSEDETAPVLLANPPGESASSDRPEEKTPEMETASEVTAASTPETTSEAAPELVPEPEVAATEPEEETPAPPVETPVAVVAKPTSEATSRPSEPVQSAAAAKPVAQATAQAPVQAAAASTGAGSGGGAEAGQGSAVTGPIRNSNDLKAMRGNPNPIYPARDRLARRQGTVVVLGRISTDGRVTDIKLEKSSGSPSMDAASLQAFRGWRYQAGQAGWVRKPFEFRLVGDAMEVPAPLGKTLKR